MSAHARIGLAILLALVVLASSAGVPLASAQVGSSNYCPPGDQDHTPPDPPGDGADRAHIDLAPGAVELRMPAHEEPPERRGLHWVAKQAGPAQIDVETKNRGNQDAPRTDVRLTVTHPDDSTTTRTLRTDPIPAGESRWNTASLDLPAGMHTLQIHVNPDKDPEEACQDNRPNNDCGTMTQGCAYTYYDNNKKRLNLFTGGLPILAVDDILVKAPTYATPGPSNASRAEITVRLANNGDAPAFNLDGDPGDAPPFVMKLSATDCDCDPTLVNVTSLAPGATRTLSASLPVHGLAEQFELSIELDAHQETADLHRTNALTRETFALPTARLLVWSNAPHEQQNNAFLVPEGNDFTFQVHVKNDGDAPARTSGGEGVRIVVQRDSQHNVVYDERHKIRSSQTVTIDIQDNARNLEKEHLYRIQVDPDHEVMEPTKSGNTIFVRARVASYDLHMELDTDGNETTVPPGVEGRIGFELTNQGTVTDTILLEHPGGDQHYEDTNGERIGHIELDAPQSARVQLVKTIPPDAEDGTRIHTAIEATSARSGISTRTEVTFVVGPDNVAPDIHILEPKGIYLSGDDPIILEITDNVAVDHAETDLFGSFQTITPDGTGQRYRLDTTGTPDAFTFTVRATDTAGNTANETFTLNRDDTPPRINNVQISPHRGVRPGDTVSFAVNAHDEAMDRVELRISQPRPGGETFQQNITLNSNSNQFVLRDWQVPERPGHYVIRVVAFDQAGNSASETHRLFVQGLNIQFVTSQPTVRPQEPQEGERVTFTYAIENTSPHFETGSFFVAFVVNFERQIGLERVNLGPGERKVLQFAWTAQPGQHAFTLVVDQAEEVAEDTDDEEDNLHFTHTGVLFPDQDLFAPETVRLAQFASFGELVIRFWFLPLALLVTLSMFAAAVVLAKRENDP